MERHLTRLVGISDNKEQLTVLQALLDEMFSSGLSSSEPLKLITSKLLSDDLNQQNSKTLLLFYCKYLESNLKRYDTLYDEVLSHIISLIKQHGYAVLYDESDYICRDALFTYYISCEQFSEAAKVLSMVNLDSSSLNFKDYDKADILIKCAESYLEDDETVDAEAFVTRASSHMNDIDDVTLHLRYRTTFARILDANRKFVEAASRYYELSTTSFANINQDDLLMLLGKAVTCALLGKTGNL
jgi:COP9 signalosome complex subunit 4